MVAAVAETEVVAAVAVRVDTVLHPQLPWRLELRTPLPLVAGALEPIAVLQQAQTALILYLTQLPLLAVAVEQKVLLELRLGQAAAQVVVLVIQQAQQAGGLEILHPHLQPKEPMVGIHHQLRRDITPAVVVVQLLLVAMVLEVPLEMAALEQQTQLLAHP